MAARSSNPQAKEQLDKMKCHLHKKLKETCKFCKKYKELLDSIEKTSSQKDDAPGSSTGKGTQKTDRTNPEEDDSPLQLSNPKSFGFSGLLQMHIVECAHFKQLMKMSTFEQLVEETIQFANGVEPYMTNNSILPTALFCCVYRMFTLGLDRSKLHSLLNSVDSPYLRCAGILYVRYGLPHDQLWDWLGEYILDDEQFQLTQDSEARTTIGDYVEGVLSQEKYFNTVFPRIPNGIVRKLEERLAPVAQYRKRTRANKDILDVYRSQGTKIEACIDGEWLGGTVLELDDERPNRVKVRIGLYDGAEAYVHLGMVILADGRHGSQRVRGRSRSRSPGGSRIDWSREKGRSDKELIEEMRSREREKACTSGKDYARKPFAYTAALAMPRDQGTASFRLMEEETFVPTSRTERRQRTPSPQRDSQGQRRSAEHQARMQQLFEKYGSQKPANASGQQGAWGDVDRPEVMRLG